MLKQEMHLPLWQNNITPLGLKRQNGGGATTPEWMIRIDNLLSSSIKGFQDYSELLGWSGSKITRETSDQASGPLMSSASVQHSVVYVVIRMNDYGPEAELRLQNGTPLEEVKIIRLGNNGDAKQLFQEVEYKNCQIVSMEQMGDDIIIGLRPTKRINTFIKYDQDGNKKGQTVSEYDYTKGE